MDESRHYVFFPELHTCLPSMVRLYSEDEREKLVMSWKVTVMDQRSEPAVSKRVLSCTVRHRCQAMTNEDMEDLVFEAVICSVCKLVKTL
jgi:hypothetical protein